MPFYDEHRHRETRKPFVASAEFWLGVVSTFILLALIVAFLA